MLQVNMELQGISINLFIFILRYNVRELNKYLFTIIDKCKMSSPIIVKEKL